MRFPSLTLMVLSQMQTRIRSRAIHPHRGMEIEIVHDPVPVDDPHVCNASRVTFKSWVYVVEVRGAHLQPAAPRPRDLHPTTYSSFLRSV